MRGSAIRQTTEISARTITPARAQAIAPRERLLIVSDTMPPDPNGVALIAFHTAELLARSFDVHVVGPGSAAFSPAISYSRVKRLPLGTPDLHIPRPALKVVANAVSAADRVIVHTPGSLGLAALHYARRLGKHSTLFQHNDYPVLVKYGLPRTLAAPLLSRMAKWVDAWSVRAAERVVAPSGATHQSRDVLRLDPPLYAFTPRTSTAACESITVAYHGRVSREKAVDQIVRAIHVADPTHRRVRFLIVGDGSQLPRVMKLAEALSVPVDHVPWCADPRRALIGADVYISASRTETYSITTLEALGCGLAIIARRVGNIPTYVTDDVNGLLFDSDHELPGLLMRLVDDAALRERLAASARRSATSDSIWEQFALASARR